MAAASGLQISPGETALPAFALVSDAAALACPSSPPTRRSLLEFARKVLASFPEVHRLHLGPEAMSQHQPAGAATGPAVVVATDRCPSTQSFKASPRAIREPARVATPLCPCIAFLFLALLIY